MASTSKTKPSPPKPRLKVNDGVSVEHYKIHRANLLLMGQSGTGKTTFTETLKNPKFTNKFEVVTSSTREPSLHNLGFRVGFNHFTLSVIDTPGKTLFYFLVLFLLCIFFIPIFSRAQ